MKATEQHKGAAAAVVAAHTTRNSAMVQKGAVLVLVAAAWRGCVWRKISSLGGAAGLTKSARQKSLIRAAGLQFLGRGVRTIFLETMGLFDRFDRSIDRPTAAAVSSSGTNIL
jgi:hypothetical protein